MQDKRITQFTMIPVPLEDYLAAGIQPNSILQTYAEDGKLIVSTVTDDDFYSENCEDCPFYDDCKEREAN